MGRQKLVGQSLLVLNVGRQDRGATKSLLSVWYRQWGQTAVKRVLGEEVQRVDGAGGME